MNQSLPSISLMVQSSPLKLKNFSLSLTTVSSFIMYLRQLCCGEKEDKVKLIKSFLHLSHVSDNTWLKKVKVKMFPQRQHCQCRWQGWLWQWWCHLPHPGKITILITMTLMMRPLTAWQNLDAMRVAGHWHLIKPGARATHPPNLKSKIYRTGSQYNPSYYVIKSSTDWKAIQKPPALTIFFRLK